jgi:hypothetical protein
LEQAMLNQSKVRLRRIWRFAGHYQKTWRAIYQRVDDVAPRTLGKAARPVHEGQRSAEKRRHLLEYLCTHPEELRPANHGRARSELQSRSVASPLP